MKKHLRFVVPFAALVALVLVGCKKQLPPIPAVEVAPPAVAPSAPTAEITATPTVVSAGDPLVLEWQTTDASSASIDGIGAVSTAGVTIVNPKVSSVYHLVAKGAGGTADATARVNVNSPPPVAAPLNAMSEEETFGANVHDILFDLDSYDIRKDEQTTIEQDASYLTSHPDQEILIGGYCDGRGSDEYNFALGQNRADAAKRALVMLGVDASRIRVISYGREKPFCSDPSEKCWQLNRRARLSPDS